MNPVSLSAILFILAEAMLALYLLRRRSRRRQVARGYKSIVQSVLAEKPRVSGAVVRVRGPRPVKSVVSAGLDL